MGSCLSKKTPCSNSLTWSNNVPETQQNDLKIATRKLHDNVTPQIELHRKRVSTSIDSGEPEKEAVEKLKNKKKEVFVIHHRKSSEDGLDPDGGTNEEASISGSRHMRSCSGSKRSFDFDRENVEGTVRPMGSRSGSRERGAGRRVSRSPVRRSQSPILSENVSGMPGKLVSVPATVTSLSIDRTGNGNGNGSDGNVNRVLVQRNVGSPRSQSPARVNHGRSESPIRGGLMTANGNEGGQQQHTLSRNGSRKSPYRRTPLNEIDLNSHPFQPLANTRPLNKGKEIREDGLVIKQPINSVSQNKYVADTASIKRAAHGTHRRTRSRGTEGYEITKTNYCRVNDLHKPNPDQMTGNYEKDQLNSSEYDAMVTPVILSGTDTLKLPHTLVRSRSGRRSRDFDVKVDEALLNPTLTTNYTSLLLQDIQKFHQNKNSNSNSYTNSNTKTNTTITLPHCVSKACSIVEAVADLNSTTRPNPSFTLTNDRRVSPMSGNFSFDPFVKSKVKRVDDLTEPSIHKYVTVRKKGSEMDDGELYGSNSIVSDVAQQNQVFSSSSREPKSGESTDRWMS